MTHDKYQIEQNANKIHVAIRTFEYYFKEEFSKTGIERCDHCLATGLRDRSHPSFDFFCSKCKGIGYIGYEKIMGEYVCRSCNGAGCSLCNYKGKMDWVSHAMGNDIREDTNEYAKL